MALTDLSLKKEMSANTIFGAPGAKLSKAGKAYFPRSKRSATPPVLKKTGNATDRRGNVGVGVAGVKKQKSAFYPRKKRN